MGTFTNLNYHIVFGTKYRRKIITPDIREDLYSYISGIVQNDKGHVISIGGIEDHIHILVGFHATTAVADMVRVLKANSSKWLNESRTTIDKFEWQSGYAAFTVSQSMLQTVENYVKNQEQHHQKRDFKSELIELLERHQITFNVAHFFEDEHIG
jgi:putative transposase